MRDYYRGVGIKIALDDTGSGYASLAVAMDLQPDIIKIDMSLVRAIDIDLARQSLVAAIQELAEKIGAAVVAEGVETVGQLEVLGQIGVRYGQGFLFGRARGVPAAPSASPSQPA
jgi:EAL domain-containing protein (putative c-di-GMP-specific phosphodiesterase class I)